MSSTRRDLWAIDQVAAFLGIQPGSARGALSRWGVRAVRREVDDSGRAHSLFDPDEVRAAHAGRPGQGARTDRKTA